MKVLRHLFALVFMGLVACASTQPARLVPPPSDALEEARKAAHALDATVILRTGCGGQFVGLRLLLTAAHCVSELKVGDGISYITRHQWQEGYLLPHNATLTRVDPEGDIALLTTEDDAPAIVRIGVVSGLGTPVQAIGHPDLEYYTVSAGFVTQRDASVDGEDYTAAVIAVWYGSSGGGLYNAEWQLIGITSMMREGGAIAYFVPPNRMWKILQINASN